MTTHASYHGGDGAGQDPPAPGGSAHVRFGCQSSNKKRTRGNNRSLNMLTAFDKNKQKALPLELDPTGQSFKFVGDNRGYFTRHLSSCVKKIPACYESWEAVPEDFKTKLFMEMFHYFDLASFKEKPEWTGITMHIHEDCGNKYRAHKYQLAKHFKEHGGWDDPELAKANPPKSITPEEWTKLVDELFNTEDFKLKSIQNSSNRAQLPYAHSCGSKPLAQRRYEEFKESGKFRLLETWRDVHTSRGKWENDQAYLDWVRIEREKKRMEEIVGSDGEIDEREVLERALGVRSGWSRGIGPKVKRASYDISNLTLEQMRREIRGLREEIDQLKANGHANKGGSSSSANGNEDDANDGEEES